MEKEDYKAVKLHNVPVENLLDSRKYCDPRKILENEDNFVFEGKVLNKMMITNKPI